MSGLLLSKTSAVRIVIVTHCYNLLNSSFVSMKVPVILIKMTFILINLPSLIQAVMKLKLYRSINAVLNYCH